MQSESGAAALRQMLAEAQRVVVFTGAGISTESGIPDFRSPGGIWTQMAPIYFDEFLASEEARRETWRVSARASFDCGVDGFSSAACERQQLCLTHLSGRTGDAAGSDRQRAVRGARADRAKAECSAARRV